MPPYLVLTERLFYVDREHCEYLLNVKTTLYRQELAYAHVHAWKSVPTQGNIGFLDIFVTEQCCLNVAHVHPLEEIR